MHPGNVAFLWKNSGRSSSLCGVEIPSDNKAHVLDTTLPPVTPISTEALLAELTCTINIMTEKSTEHSSLNRNRCTGTDREPHDLFCILPRISSPGKLSRRLPHYPRS
jgi:hypothetical protein